MVKKGVIKKCCNMAMENILYEGTTDVDLFSRPFEIEMLKNEYLKKNYVESLLLQL